MDNKLKKFKNIHPVIFAFLAVGFGETVGQILIIRELIVNFQGNELSIGIILSNWMLMIALGSWVSAKIIEKISPKVSFFVITLIFYSILLPALLFLTRIISSFLVIKTGETAGLFTVFYSSLIIIAPLCILHGFQFTLGCRIISAKFIHKEMGAGDIYVWEALGSMLGGIIFTYLMLRYLKAFEIATIAIILNLAAAIFLLKPHIVFNKKKANLSQRFLAIISIVLVLFFILSIFSQSTDKLNNLSRSLQWQDQKLIFHKDSPYGNLAITRSNGQSNFYNNGLLMFSYPGPDISFLEEKIHFPLLFHSSPEKILLIGNGVDGSVEKILKHPVDKLNYIELDPLIVYATVELLDNSTFKDQRIEIIYTDGRFYINSSHEKYDVIIVNLPPPSTLQLNRFYTREFFQEAYNILNDSGILSFTLPASDTYMSIEMLNYNRSIYRAIKEVFPEVLVIPGDNNIFIASGKNQIERPSKDVIIERFQQRDLKTDLFTIPYIEYKLSKERISNLFSLYKDNESVKTNMDLRPIGTYYNLALWNVMFYPQLRQFFNIVSKMSFWWFFIPAIILIFIFTFLKKLGWKKTNLKINYLSILFSIATTGFTGMSISILLLFLYQVMSGYLYLKIGIIIAAFMFGIAAGGSLMNKKIIKIKRNEMLFIIIEAAIIIFLVLIPVAVMLFFNKIKNPQNFFTTDLPISLLNFAAGFLVGLEFPLANKINLQVNKKPGLVAGTLYASDLIGGIFGAILTAVFFAPILGIINTCALAIVLKVLSIILIISFSYAKLKNV